MQNKDPISRLPAWARNRIKDFKFSPDGRSAHYSLTISALDYDFRTEDVHFEAASCTELIRMLRMYKGRLYRCGTDYMIFR